MLLIVWDICATQRLEIGSVSNIKRKGGEGSFSTGALRKSWSPSLTDFLKVYKQLIYCRILGCHNGGYVEFYVRGKVKNYTHFCFSNLFIQK
jgi:hypothetical protein